MQRTTRLSQGTRPLGLLTCTNILFLMAMAVTPARAQTSVDIPAQGAPSAAQPVTITLDEAIQRAKANEPAYAAALAEGRASALERSIARAGLLPSVTFHNQALYTEPNGLRNQAGQTGSQPSPRFIANNAVREYASQAVVNETIGLGQLAAIRRADATAAFAAAELEISRRGLIGTVNSLYFGVISAANKVAIAERAHAEAADFTSLTGKREQGREAAHADVVKAQLQEQQRQRDLADAKLAADKARLELGVVLFPDPRTPYVLAPPQTPGPLASRADVDQAAGKNNPELRSALATLRQNNADVIAARAAYLPALSLGYIYGIDAPQFAVNGPDKVRNLGYSAIATLDIPVWDWLATEHKVKQSQVRRDAAKVALSFTQRRLIARLDEAYAEATAARDQLASLDVSVATAEESLRLTKLRYTGGEATVLEVVDAQTAFLGAENAREDMRVRYRAALADLQTLTGTMNQ